MNLDKISKDPIKNLALGNSIPSEYSFYKYKQEGFNHTLTEKDNYLLLVSAYRFMLFDLAYLLDFDPTNQELFSYYNQIKKEYNTIENYYESTFGNLSHTSNVETSTYSYLNKPWVDA